ncbi:hypothetical protein KNE206_76870 [Kitasatospora sp. NE20-6]|uniref:hypothetical protein n=1 Tax=Kitasatospora sp. NE20-6 TaxID=2859066 RepID=UPI0034DBBA2A
MASVNVTVCLPPEAGDDVAGALREALAPFFLDTSSAAQDRGMWDEIRISGGNSGTGFAVAAGHEDDPRLLHDDPGHDGSRSPSVPGVCAGGPRALLDFSRPTLAHERVVAASWDLWHRLALEHPPVVPLADFVARWQAGAFPDDPQGEGMFAAYRAQPLIRAYRDHPFGHGPSWLSFPDPYENPLVGYPGTRDEYIREFTRPRTGTDLLTVDGWWLEPGGDAFHAVCEPDSCPHRRPLPGLRFSDEYVAGLPGDTILLRMVGHV